MFFDRQFKCRNSLEEFLSNPSEVRFDDVCYILTAFGFEGKPAKGSRHSLRNTDGLKITVPKKGGQKVKGVYVKQIVALLKLEE